MPFPTVTACVRLARPKFLIYSMLLCVGLGSALALHAGVELNASLLIAVWAVVWFTHLMTHFCNEYFDLEADRAHVAPTRWTGGSRVLVEGKVPPSVSLGLAIIFLVGAVTIATLAMPDLTACCMAWAMIALGWFYTAPPIRMNYCGLGELAVAIGLNGLCPLLSFYVQVGEISPAVLMLLAPMMVLQHARMMIMNLADRESDRRVGKNTLVVWLGTKAAIGLFTMEQLLGYGLMIWFGLSGLIPSVVAVAMLSTAPVSIWTIRRLRSGGLGDPRLRDQIPFWASTQVGLVIATAVTGLVLSIIFSRDGLDPDILACVITIGLYVALLPGQIRAAREGFSESAR